MCAKCSGIIKFSLSLKMKKKKWGAVPPPQNIYFLFSPFSLRLTKKHSKQTCRKYVIYKFCLRHFSLKCIIKKNYLPPYCPLKFNKVQCIIKFNTIQQYEVKGKIFLHNYFVFDCAVSQMIMSTNNY